MNDFGGRVRDKSRRKNRAIVWALFAACLVGCVWWWFGASAEINILAKTGLLVFGFAAGTLLVLTVAKRYPGKRWPPAVTAAAAVLSGVAATLIAAWNHTVYDMTGGLAFSMLAGLILALLLNSREA